MAISKGVGIRWTTPLDVLATGAADYGDRLDGAIGDMMGEEALRATDDMRLNAPWTDRQPYARGALHATYEHRGNQHVLAFYTTNSEYGWALELARAGKYAIIRPTMNQYEPIIAQRAQRLIGR